MLSKMHTPENCCVEPDHYRKYYRAFFWNSQRLEKKAKKKAAKKDKRKNKSNSVSLSSTPSLLGNPSQFAVFASVRSSILSRWTLIQNMVSDHSDDSDSEDHTLVQANSPYSKLPKITTVGLRTVFSLVAQARTMNASFCEQALKAMLDVLQGYAPEDLHQEPSDIIQNLHNMLIDVSSGVIPGPSSNAAVSIVSSNSTVTSNIVTNNANPGSSVSSNSDSTSASPNRNVWISSPMRHNTVSGSNASSSNTTISISSNITANDNSVASGSKDTSPAVTNTGPTPLTAAATSCLLALCVARGDAELMLNAAASLIMSPPILADQYITIPANLTTLQRSVQSVLLGTTSRNCWLNYGVPTQSLYTSFPADLPPDLSTVHGEPGLVIRSLASDGAYLYLYTSKGLVKVGSGYAGTIRQHMYLYKPDFFPTERHGWLGCCKNKMYVRLGRKKADIYQVNKDTLDIEGIIRLDPGPQPPHNNKSFIFTDGFHLGMLSLTNHDTLSVKMYNPDQLMTGIPLAPHQEFTLHLLKNRTLALGWAPFEELERRRVLDPLDPPVASQIEDTDDERIMNISAGQDFALLRTSSGKVYYTGKASSLGYKIASPPNGRWVLMKETTFSRNDPQNAKMSRIVQVAVGHEGAHAILVVDDGSVLFTGMSRRGEDGDIPRQRRQPKPYKPKRLPKVEGHHVIYAACNYGTTALITRQGLLLMYGKDIQHADAAGIVTALRHERIIQVALGKAHAVALTNTGLVYTFGLNNRGQCGRDFGYTKERHGLRTTSQNALRMCDASEHQFTTDDCRICVMCRECTGFSTACQCAEVPDRLPKERCGCGEGDSGCTVCGVCRRCAKSATDWKEIDDDEEVSGASDSGLKSGKEGKYEGGSASTDTERESKATSTSLPPARIAVPGGHKIVEIACGLQHTVMLTEHGEVLTFGSNQYGQLGAGNITAHHRIVRVKLSKCAHVAAGSNHTAVLTRDGELYTFGCYQKGALGRQWNEDNLSLRGDRSVWYATPGKVMRLGPSNITKVMWMSASGDQTFVQVSQTLLKADTLLNSTVTANKNCIMILPNRSEHLFKCITINKSDGSCRSHAGPEQVNFIHSIAGLDPLYDVLWVYQAEPKIFHCYNILVFDTHTLQKCSKRDYYNEVTYTGMDDYHYPNYGPMKKIDDFKNMQTIDTICNDSDHKIENSALLSMSVVNQELAIPCVPNSQITRLHAAMHLIGCLDTLNIAQETKYNQVQCKCDYMSSPSTPIKEDFMMVNRFESNGGGWGYSGHSVEAIRFMVDTDVLLGGYAVYGGRGEYTAKIKLFDLGNEGGEQEGDGELLAESDEIVFECLPKEKYPILFEMPIPLVPSRWYVAWATISGPSSDCGSSGQTMVVNEDAIFHFKTSKKSNNGTDVNAGQIPSLLYTPISHDQGSMISRSDNGDTYIILSRKMSRKITLACFRSLITLLQWAWSNLKKIIMDTHNLVPSSFLKMMVMKRQNRLVYIIRACMRIIKFYINEVYPQHPKKRTSANHLIYADVINEVRNILQSIMADETPNCSMIPSSKRGAKSKTHRICNVAFQLDLTDAVLSEAHKTLIGCFYAFFPTPAAKWNHLCSLLIYAKDGIIPAPIIRELTATIASLCVSKSLREILNYVAPVAQNPSDESKHSGSSYAGRRKSETKTSTVQRSSKPPPVPPRSGRDSRNAQQQPQDITEPRGYLEWNLSDILPRMLDVVLVPTRKQMSLSVSSQPHDHGERLLQDQLAKYSSKFLARVVAELTYSATNTKDETEVNTSNCYLSTPSRYMRMNQTRGWNTGNGSPDAICFSVDRPGITLVGVGVYGGLGNYDYELELLHDQLRGATEETNPAHCWFSVEVAHGTFTPSDCHNEIAQLKFDRPIPLKEDVRYAIRFCNHGGRTSNGDCGLPSVKGPDGTTFRFNSCSLSFNGTTLTRGQIPTLLYYAAPSVISNTSSENMERALAAVRATVLRISALIFDRTANMFSALRNTLTQDEFAKNSNILQACPAVNILIPYVLANLESLTDSKSMVAILEMVHVLLPQVTASNLIVPNNDGPNLMGIPNTTTSPFYTWIESEHPYKQASITNMRVLFPSTVTWLVVEMDPNSITAQPEDTLTIYAMATGNKRHHCHCGPRQPKDLKGKGMIQKNLQIGPGEPGMYEPVTDESVCLEYNCMYVAVTPKMSNMHSEWPHKSMIIPGNEVIFSLEAATDYLSEYKGGTTDDSRYGFRALVVGYEDAPITIYKYGLSALEMELAYAGASCAARLLSPTIDIAPLSPATILDFQNSPPVATIHQDGDERTNRGSFESNEALLLSRGLDISSPPTIDQIMMGHSLSRCQSKARLFLADFISMADLTTGGRLARWLQPDSRVEPANCQVQLPAGVPRIGTPLLFTVVPRDQYGDQVRSPALKVEMLVQLSESGAGSRQSRRVSQADTRMFGGHPPPPVIDVPYEMVSKENMNFHAISIMKAYQNYSFEEIRAAGDNASGVSRVPPERLVVRPLIDGTYSASWMPRQCGVYAVECTFDGKCAHQELSVEVKDQISAGLPSTSTATAPSVHRKEPPLLTRPTKLRKFCATDTAGLRVRVHPSLQSEELGIIPPNANIGFTEEVQNNDGTWLRLSHDAVKLYLEANTTSAVALTALSADPPEAWCLQYHQQLDRTLLQPLEAQLFTTKNGDWDVTAKSSNDNNSPTNPTTGDESDNDNEDNESAILFSSMDLRKRQHTSSHNESDSADDVNIFNYPKKLHHQPSDSRSDTGNPFMVPKPLTCRAEKMFGEPFSGSMESLSRVDCSSKNVANGNGCSEDWDGSRPSSKSSMVVPSHEEPPHSEPAAIDNNGRECCLMQTGTQTSPDNAYESRTPMEDFAKQKDDKTLLKVRTDRKRFFKRSTTSTPSAKSTPTPPRSPFKSSPVKQPPPKYSMSPSQAETYRAIFAALIWHEGIVHDAMACATYLKFQPNLPKHGYRVKTRGLSSVSSGDVASSSRPLQHQRHSVEVSYAGEYMHIQPSTLETLTRSAVNANANRNRNKRVSEAAEPPISEEEGANGTNTGDSNFGVVTVLPPAMRALVAVWDQICEAREIAVTPEKYMKEDEIEKTMCGIDRKMLNYSTRAKAKKEYRASSTSKTPYSVSCELCNGIAVTPPLAAHMRHTHPGCKAPCSKGYDRSGSYVDAGPALTACGQLAQEYSNGAYFNSSHANAAYYLWYMYCERCRDKSIKASSAYKQSRPKIFSDSNFEQTEAPPSATQELFDHHNILENALFLLDLSPLCGSGDGPGMESRSPPTPASNMWVPSPDFQSLNSLGVSIYNEDDISEYDARYDLIRRWHALGIGGMYNDLLHGFGVYQYQQNPNLYLPAPPPPSRFHRSVSMGQTGARDLVAASEAANLFMRHHDIGQDGMSDVCLLTQPSAPLLRLIGCAQHGPEGHEFIISAVDAPKLDVDYLLNRPALTFIRSKKDLVGIRTKMDAAIRIATVRQYSLQALNWMLRSVTQPTSLHDIMWWFCSALETFSKYDGTNDNKKNLLMEGGSSSATPSWVVAGGIGRGGRSPLHAFLQSIAELMPKLPPCSPALLQAVRCWALHYSPTDHVFLHRSQVFSVISKILSHTEEDLYEENVVGFLPNENCDNVITKDGFIWVCTDMTGWCDISVSSRPGMMPALTDSTTETFWESGEEDRNKPKWIQIACPGGVFNEKPHIVSLHIDNTRDTANKTLMVSFLYSGNSTELFQMQDVEVDVKAATWISYTLPKNAAPPVRIRCELRGPDSSVRVRQLKVLAVPSLRPNYQVPSQNTSHYKMILERVQPAALILHQNIEMETLRVFRLITSQVFGKLLEWDSGSSSETGEGSYSRAASVGEEGNPDDTDLREHVVGILFSGSKLTNLQKQVMSHIVTAIGAEAQKAREEWETALLAEEPDDGSERASPIEAIEPTKQDNYCFEMLSLLLALSGSQVGREHLAKRTELLPDLLSLLHTSSDRVQRQVISLLRRVIGEISPQKMLNALNAGNEGSAHRVTLIDNLVTFVAKAIVVQVKVKGFNGGGTTRGEPVPSSPRAPSSITMGSSGIPIPPGFWFMKGQTSKKHAHLVVKLLTDMAEEKLTSQWGAETRATLASYTVRLAGVPDGERRPGSCIAACAMWLALGALCVIEESYVELMDPRNTEGGEGGSVRSNCSDVTVKDSRPYCVNHDDGETLAVIDCRSCGPLCHECDRCLHLNRAARTHHRQICKEEESTIRVDIHEGCGRAKLFWLLLLIDRRTLKALAEFRGMSTHISDEAAGPRVSLPGPPGLAGICRFCGAHSNSGLLAIGNVCADQECQEHSRNSCSRVLPCGHLCGGVVDELTCLPCLYGCSGGEAAPVLRQDADDMCMICFTDPLAAAPAIQLKCGHVFHLHCCKKVLTNKWIGPRITFAFAQCPICKEDMGHAVLEQLLEPVRRLEEEVRKKALMRLEYEGLLTTPAIHSRYRGNVAAYAMDRYAYYVCFKCGKAYFGGQARCDVDASNVYDPAELLCGGCSDVAGARTCPKHGADFLEYKCRYCCTVAVFFCFGTSHFCNTCHDDFQRVTNIPKHALPHCPAVQLTEPGKNIRFDYALEEEPARNFAGPKGKQLEGTSDDCPLHISHPPTGEEFALGCGVCRNSQTF